jgi:hypothetical protein
VGRVGHNTRGCSARGFDFGTRDPTVGLRLAALGEPTQQASLFEKPGEEKPPMADRAEATDRLSTRS